MKALIMIAIAFSFSLANAKGKAKACDDYSQYKDVSMTEMENIVKAGSATIIDVNSKKSFNNGKGAVSENALHFGSIKRDFASKMPKDKNAEIVAYCGGPMCTAWQRAAEMACELGYKNIKHFSQGIKGWNKAHKKG